ncbi:MAG: hypothetical protein RL528_305 [Bacteroidota bacterium]|jgi:hypothetical protein
MKKSIFVFASLFMLLVSNSIFAQAADPGIQDPEAAAPIDNYVWVLATIGLLFVFLKFRNFCAHSTK